MNTTRTNKAGSHRLILAMAVLAMIVGAFALVSLPSSEVADATATTIDSGTCGTGLTWSMDSTGALTITGTGAMNNFSDEPGSEAPWYWAPIPVMSVTISSGVTNIGDYAFTGTYITTVTIPSTVTAIGKHAFDGNDILHTVTFASTPTVTSFGDYAFSNNTILRSFTIPSSLTTLGDCVFSGCDKLKTIDSESSAFVWYNNALYNSDKTELYVLPQGQNKTEFSLESSTTTIHAGAFAGDWTLSTITLSDSLTTIGKYAFYNCSSIRSITIPESLVSIGDNAFEGCTSLSTIALPVGFTTIGECVFKDCTYFKSITFAEGNASFYVDEDGLVYSASKDRLVFVPPFFDGTDGAFSVPDTVTSIAGAAFQNCLNLTSVSYESSVTLGDYVFQGCRNISSFTIPTDKIAEGLFKGTGITSLTIPNTVTEIGDYAFMNSMITDLTLGNGLVKVGNYAFDGIPYHTDANLDKPVLSLPSSLRVIGNGAFTFSQAVSVQITDGVKVLPSQAFADGSELTLPSSVKYLGSASIDNIQMTIPKTVEKIRSHNTINPTIHTIEDGGLLSWQNNLLMDSTGSIIYCYRGDDTTLEIPKEVIAIAGAGIHSSKLTSVTFESGSNLVYLGENALARNSSLETVELPDGLKVMGVYTLSGSKKISSLTIPNTVLYIGQQSLKIAGLTEFAFEENSQLLYIGNQNFDTATMATLSLPSSVSHIGKNLICRDPNLATISINDNPYYTVIDGILYDADKTVLISATSVDRTSLTLPDTLLEISNMAFMNKKLSAVTIPASVIRINNYTFYDCGLESLIFEDKDNSNLALIGNYSVYNFRGTSIDLPSKVSTIGSVAFGGSDTLETVRIPTSALSVADNILSGSTKGVIIYYGDQGYVTVIDDIVYDSSSMRIIVSCQKDNSTPYTLTSLPNSVVEISNYAFKNCSGLTSITVPNSVEVIGSNAFDGCTNLVSISIPDSIRTIGSYAFANCSSLSTVSIDRNSDLVTIPDYCFQNTAALTNINLEGFETIGQYAFDHSGIASFVIPSSVKSLGSFAFTNSGLTEIIIPSTVTSLGIGIFSYCDDLITCEVQTEGVYLSAGLFMHCTNLKTINISGSLLPTGYAIHGNTFTDTPSVEELRFSGCSNVNSVARLTDSTSVKKVTLHGSSPFANFSSKNHVATPWYKSGDSFTTLILEEGVTQLGDWMFAGSNITSLVCPSTMTTINASAFRACTNLSTLEIRSSDLTIVDSNSLPQEYITVLTIPGNAACLTQLSGMTNLVSLTITGSSSSSYSDNYTAMPWYLSREKLKQIIFQDDVTSVGAYMFKGCNSVTDVTLGFALRSIGEQAFYGCTSLDDLYIYSTNTPEIGSLALDVGQGAASQPKALNVYSNGWAESFDFSGTYTEDATTIRMDPHPCGTNVMYFVSGDKLYLYRIDSSTSGSVTDFTSENIAPWYDKPITEVIIEYGIDHIGSESFKYNSIQKMSLGNGYTLMTRYQTPTPMTLGADAFQSTMPTKLTVLTDTGSFVINSAAGLLFKQIANYICVPGAVWTDASGDYVTCFMDGGTYSPVAWEELKSENVAYSATCTITLV